MTVFVEAELKLTTTLAVPGTPVSTTATSSIEIVGGAWLAIDRFKTCGAVGAAPLIVVIETMTLSPPRVFGFDAPVRITDPVVWPAGMTICTGESPATVPGFVIV